MRSMKRSSNFSYETKKIRKLLNEEVKLGIHPSSDSETEDVDLHKELYPLKHYMNNKEEMIEQMFSIIKGDKLMKMLPPVLKDMPLDELKADCLIHLLGMSRKRIIAILEGKEINSSSDSETHSDTSSPRRKMKPMVKPIVIKQEGCSDISDNSEEVILIDPDLESVQGITNTKSSKNNSEGNNRPRRHHTKNRQSKNKLSDKKFNKEIQEPDNQGSDGSEEDTHESSPHNSNEEKIPKEGKTLLEILELEMRARAIRALLHKNNTPEGEEDTKPLEKPSPNRNISAEEETNKVTPKRKFRKKKRKNDDVIVITPKLVTIDLTDENDICSAKKKSVSSKKSENKLLHKTQGKDDIVDELGATNACTTTNKDECLDEIGMESNTTGINKKIELGKSTESDVSSELPTRNSDHPNLKKSEIQKSNWAQRWLESKEVKKVVSTSKICGNIRKRIKNAKLAKQNRIAPQVNQQVKSQEIHGSVDEYQLLPKSSKVIDLNAKSLDVCNPGSSVISNEEDPGKQNPKETCSTIEQVQDVSSTKNESSKECFQENVFNNSNDENIVVEDNDSSNSQLKLGHIDGVDLKQCTSESKLDNSVFSLNESKFNPDVIDETNLNDADNISLDNERVKNKSLLSSTTEFENKQLELDNTQSQEENDHFILSSKNNIDELAEKSLNKEILCPQTDLTAESNHDTESNQDTESNSVFENSGQKVKFCDLNSIPTEINKILSQVNEPETLEIDITDEDRNIDGILDENPESDSTKPALSATTVIEID